MLAEATRHLIEVAFKPETNDEQLQAVTDSFFKETVGLSPDKLTATIEELAKNFVSPDPRRGAHLAVCAGAFIERGANPDLIAPAIKERLADLLPLAVKLGDACRERMTIPVDRNPQVMSDELDKAYAAVVPDMPEEELAWHALHQFWRPMVAAGSRSMTARQGATDLAKLAEKIADFHEGAHWLHLLLNVLDDAPLLVIEPETNLGIEAKISGVVDNFQLHILLMDVFPSVGFTAKRRVSKAALYTARGTGVQQSTEEVVEAWDMFSWNAVQPSLSLPTGETSELEANYLFNGTVPTLFPVFEGQRVVLLGAPSAKRSWNALRTFEALHAKLEVVRKLTRDEVRSWLQKFATAAAVDSSESAQDVVAEAA